MAAGNGNSVWLGAIHVRVSRRPGDSRRGLDAGTAGCGPCFALRQPAPHHLHSISYHDAAPILQALQGPGVPKGWQGGLGFRYHLGGQGSVKVHLVSQQDYQRRIIWDVIGKIKGSEFPTIGWSSAIIATPGFTAPLIPAAAPRPCLNRFTELARCCNRLAAQADNCLCELGRRGRGPDRLDGVGGAKRQGP